jgi:DNA-binding HxlR family transcriptional regulator
VQRTTFGKLACSIARTLDVIGEPWSPLILRDVYVGINRFDQIQQDLQISRKVLTERLKWLIEAGVLERQEYSSRPPRHEYVLTTRPCSTGTTPAARSVTSNCTARCAISRCARPTSTSCPALARPPSTRCNSAYIIFR